MSNFDVPVLVVGGGPVGLALAGDLGWRGIPTMLIEQSDGIIEQPRQDLVSIRTMEFCRRWGLLDAVVNCPYPQDYGQDFVFVTSISGFELVREVRPPRNQSQAPVYSPQRRERCPQNMFDPILADFARSFATNQVLYRHRLLGFQQNSSHVSVKVKNLDTGEIRSIRTRYLVGCDGAGSSVRRAVKAQMLGNAILTHSINVLISCPNFNQLHDKGDVYRYILVDTGGIWATMVAIDGRDRWRFQYVGGPETLNLGEAEIRALIHRAFGRPFGFEILSIMPWTRRQLVASQYRFGDIFLVGDAAHEMSPTGAFGMNTGLAEAVDLSWKLAAVFDGWAPDAILDTYDLERRPVAKRNVDEAAGNLERMVARIDAPQLLDDDPEAAELRRRIGRQLSKSMEREYRADGVHMGYRYDTSPICIPDGTPTPPDDPVNYNPIARPGARAPHAWLSANKSTLDLFGTGFVLLDFTNGQTDTHLAAAAQQAGVPLTEVLLERPDILELYGMRFVLVRPDGHVAWRSNEVPQDPHEIIKLVSGRCIVRTDNARREMAS